VIDMARPLRAIVQGATGAVGSELLRQLLADARFGRVVALSRRALDVTAPNLEVRILSDFLDVSPIADVLPETDVAFSALGISQTQEPDPAKYRTITYDYVLTLGRALHAANPEAKMVFVSGQGADETGNSRVLFARVKGEAERDLRGVFGDRLTVLRPGVIRPVQPRERPPWFEHVLVPLAGLLAPVAPGLTSSTVEIAHAMMQAAIGDTVGLMENREIRRVAKGFATEART
jgi:nucleoside-diphosphate-sugar epimerase